MKENKVKMIIRVRSKTIKIAPAVGNMHKKLIRWALSCIKEQCYV